MFPLLLVGLALASPEVVFIGIVSVHGSLERREALRATWAQFCFDFPPKRTYYYKFLLSSDQQLQEADQNAQDVLLVEIHDKDPPVLRDETYVLPDKPTSIAAKQLFGIEYASFTFGESLQFYVHLDDDSFLSIPRLDRLLDRHAIASPRVFMGYLLRPPLRLEEPLKAAAFYERTCQIYSQLERETCVDKIASNVERIVDYFGNLHSPTWALGMGYVYGREVVEFLRRNRKFLKMRASSDMQVGFWLVAMEGVNYVHLGSGSGGQQASFHDYPRHLSMFAKPCSTESTLVHRVTPANLFAEFDAATCALACPTEKTENEKGSR